MWTMIILFLAVACYIAANQFYKQTNDFKRKNFSFFRFKTVPKKLKMVNFGTTNALFAFNSYKELGLRGYNFSMQTESFEGDSLLLKHFTPNIAHDAIVCFTLAPCVGFYRNKMLPHELDYYLITGQGVENTRIKYCINKLLPLFPFKIKRGLHIIKDSNPINDILDLESITIDEKNAMKRMADMIVAWKNLFNLSSLEQTELGEDNIRNLNDNLFLLKKMVLNSKEHLWQPIIVITPFSKYLNKYISNNFIDVSIGHMINEITKEMKVPIFDYRTDAEFQDNLSLFLDGGFRLSKKGSEIFMKKLCYDITSRGIIANNSTLS